MEPTQSAHDDYYARTQKELEGMVWSHPSIEHSWYKNSEGKIHILSSVATRRLLGVDPGSRIREHSRFS